VIPAGISSMFTQDRPVANKSPINMPQKTQGITNATARVVLILSPHSSCLYAYMQRKKGAGGIREMII
jgi:hypothetical protein